MSTGFSSHDLAEIARCVVEQQTSLQAFPLDPGGGARPLADFTLQSGGKPIGVLEVTAVRPSEREAFAHAARGAVSRVPGSRLVWNVVVQSTTVRVKGLLVSARPLLSQIEAELPSGGFVEVLHPDYHPWGRSPVSAELNTALYAAGMSLVLALPAKDPSQAGRVVWEPPAVGGMLGPTLVTEEVQSALDAEDNQLKLLQEEVEFRELFVWLVDTPGSLALRTPLSNPQFSGGYPVDGPRLPIGITRVWVGGLPNAEPPYAAALWQSVGDHWTVVRPNAIDSK